MAINDDNGGVVYPGRLQVMVVGLTSWCDLFMVVLPMQSVASYKR